MGNLPISINSGSLIPEIPYKALRILIESIGTDSIVSLNEINSKLCELLKLPSGIFIHTKKRKSRDSVDVEDEETDDDIEEDIEEDIEDTIGQYSPGSTVSGNYPYILSWFVTLIFTAFIISFADTIT